MRRFLAVVPVLLLSAAVWAQTFEGCSCGKNPPPHPANRTMKPYAQEPEDMRPWGKFSGGEPYYEHYTNLIEYNGAAREVADADVNQLSEVRVGFIGPIANHPDEVFGKRMLNGAQMAIDEANAKGGYGGKPFKLMLHNDSAIWGASSNEVIKMAYDDKVWAMFGSISGDTTHIALRVALKVEVPLISSAATDPTIPETIIPWYFTNLQDDRVQGYTLARRIFTEVGLKRVAILRVNDRYGRFGVGKFRDAARRLGHVVVIEQKFKQADQDFRRQLRVINDSRVDGIVLWTDEAQTAMIMQQMKELGMKQRLFGSHRTIGDELLKKAGPLAENFEAVFPYDASREDTAWKKFNADYEAKYHEKPEQFAALAYDAMQVILRAICQAGLNRGRIRDALTSVTEYRGVTGQQVYDPNCKNVSPMFLATVKNGKIQYRHQPMAKAYATIGENDVKYTGPELRNADPKDLKIAVFGPKADEAVKSAEIVSALASMNTNGKHVSLVPVVSDANWGKSSTQLVDSIYKDHVVGIISLDRNSSHLAEQLAVKTFVPVIALSSDKTLTTVNIPWIFRLSKEASLEKAVQVFGEAIAKGGPNAEKIRNVLASGTEVAGVRFATTGEPKQ
jgi:ABC-type branched-subunit amino acid transport system substrate-binding protein